MDGPDYSMLGYSTGEGLCLDEVFTRALNEVNGALKRRFITGLKNNSSICKLELEECDVSESGPGYDILNAFKERKSKLTKLFQSFF